MNLLPTDMKHITHRIALAVAAFLALAIFLPLNCRADEAPKQTEKKAATVLETVKGKFSMGQSRFKKVMDGLADGGVPSIDTNDNATYPDDTVQVTLVRYTAPILGHNPKEIEIALKKEGFRPATAAESLSIDEIGFTRSANEIIFCVGTPLRLYSEGGLQKVMVIALNYNRRGTDDSKGGGATMQFAELRDGKIPGTFIVPVIRLLKKI